MGECELCPPSKIRGMGSSCPQLPSSPPLNPSSVTAEVNQSGGPSGRYLKAGHLKIGFGSEFSYAKSNSSVVFSGKIPRNATSRKGKSGLDSTARPKVPS